MSASTQEQHNSNRGSQPQAEESGEQVSAIKALCADPRTYRMVVSIGLLFLFFLLYSAVQERIMSQPYGIDEQGNEAYFQHSAFLVFNNRVVTLCIAVLLALRGGEQIAPQAPLRSYFGASISNFMATWCQYEALKYVSFPTQTLGKCGKVIPVLVLGSLGLGRKGGYGQQQYIEGFLITVGCAVFLLTGETKAPQTDRDDSVYGLMLMGAYLFCDGFTSTIQERMFRGASVSTYNMMIYVNTSSAFLSIFTLLSTGVLSDSIAFALRYPTFMWNAFGLSLCAMFGQQVIYYIIKNEGALVFATAMTTRQLFQILLSCLLYAHPLSIGQVFGTVIVFGTLYWKAVMKGKAKRTEQQKAAAEKPLTEKIDSALKNVEEGAAPRK